MVKLVTHCNSSTYYSIKWDKVPKQWYQPSLNPVSILQNWLFDLTHGVWYTCTGFSIHSDVNTSVSILDTHSNCTTLKTDVPEVPRGQKVGVEWWETPRVPDLHAAESETPKPAAFLNLVLFQPSTSVALNQENFNPFTKLKKDFTFQTQTSRKIFDNSSDIWQDGKGTCWWWRLWYSWGSHVWLLAS